MILSIKIGSLFKQLRIFNLFAFFIKFGFFKSFIIVSLSLSLVLLVL